MSNQKITNTFFTAKRSRTNPGAILTTTGYNLLGGFLAILFLFPLVSALLNSFKSSNEANQSPPTWFPQNWSIENYTKLTDYGAGVGVYLTNSLLLSTLTVVLTVAISVLAGYGFARFKFWGKNLLFGTTLGILMVPYATILLPLYIVLGKFGIQDSIFGLSLVLVMFQLPFGVYMLRNSFESVPKELEEAALLDGCSTLGALRHVSLRIVTPGIVTVALFAFLASWNEFLAPLIFLNRGDSYTLPIMLVNLRSGSYGAVDFGVLQAGIVIAAVPCLLLYVFLQRFYVTGLVAGAVRG